MADNQSWIDVTSRYKTNNELEYIRFGVETLHTGELLELGAEMATTINELYGNNTLDDIARAFTSSNPLPLPDEWKPDFRPVRHQMNATAALTRDARLASFLKNTSSMKLYDAGGAGNCGFYCMQVAMIYFSIFLPHKINGFKTLQVPIEQVHDMIPSVEQLRKRAADFTGEKKYLRTSEFLDDEAFGAFPVSVTRLVLPENVNGFRDFAYPSIAGLSGRALFLNLGNYHWQIYLPITEAHEVKFFKDTLLALNGARRNWGTYAPYLKFVRHRSTADVYSPQAVAAMSRRMNNMQYPSTLHELRNITSAARDARKEHMFQFTQRDLNMEIIQDGNVDVMHMIVEYSLDKGTSEQLLGPVLETLTNPRGSSSSSSSEDPLDRLADFMGE